MGLFFDYDYWNNLETPSFVLCNVNKDRIGILRVSERNLHYNNEIPEISFKMMKYIDGNKNPYYDKVLPLQYIYLENIGYFQITKKPITITSESIEYKQVTAQSSEIEFGQKYINTFTINMGTVESIDGVCLYQVGDEKHSLLNLVLEKIPSWSVGYVDLSIATLQRSFEIDNQDVYSFLTEDAAEAFGCIFVFDTLNNIINVYDKDKISEDTNIIVSFKNLLKEVQIEPDIDSIKTCLTLIGEDDLTIRELNMGYDRIYNFDYFANTDYMSEDLIEAYNKYKENFEKYRVQYTKLITQYQNLIIEIAKLDHEMLPETPLPKKDDVLITTQELANNKAVWREYCLTELNTYKKAYEGRQSVLMQKGYGDTSKSEYNSLYLPVYTIIKNIDDEIIIRESQIKNLEDQKLDLNIQMQAIIDIIDIQNNFTKEQWLYLSKLIREDTITDSNYVVTDTMTQEEALEMQQAFLDYGNEQMNKVSQPQFTFTLDMANIFAIPEFRDKFDKFSLFNYIMVSIRDDYNIKAKILSFDINFEDKKDFSVTFGSIYKYKNSDIFSTAVDAMATASSASTSVSFNKSQWNNASNDSLNIKDMISSGLISAGANLVNSKSTMEIDERGLFMNNDSTSSYPNDSAALTGSNLLFTSDGWKTVRTALGRFSYTKSDGTVVNTYGLISDTVLAGYVGGSLIEGSTITGTQINNGNGTFRVDANGNMTANSATIKGNISVSTITGSTITGSSFNNGNGTFYVDTNGNMTANSATIKGSISSSSISSCTITGTSFNNGNGTFSVDANGSLTAKSANITGTINSSSGSIGGWTIIGNSIYNGIPYTGQQNSNSTGMGTYGTDWAFWAGNGRFSVNQSGHLYANDVEIKGDIEATSGKFTGEVNATSGTFKGKVYATEGEFDSVTIKNTCTVAGEAISGTIGSQTKPVYWSGSVFDDAYIPCLNNQGILNRALSIPNISITTNGGVSYSGTSYQSLGHVYTSGILPTGEGTGNLASIGNSGRKFNFYGTLYGTVNSTGSSRTIKTNINPLNIDRCIPIILNTEIVEYNYKEDLIDNSDKIQTCENQKNLYIQSLNKLEKDFTDEEKNVINSYDEEIITLKNKCNIVPEKRYGFISEDAPWELVAKDRKSVDTYSAVAMCFGAIQVMEKRICELENKVKELEMKGTTNNG